MNKEIKFQLKWSIIIYIISSLFIELLKYIDCYDRKCYFFTFVAAIIINNLYINAREKFTLEQLNRK